MKPFLFCLFIYLSHILISCSSTKKSVSSSIFHLPDSLPALPQSEIDLPLKINARAILFKANFLLPGEFTSEGWPNYSQPSCDFRYKYRFVRSGFTISCVNNILGVQLSGSYQVAGAKCLCSMNKPVSPWISGSCGFGKEPLRHVNINVNSRLSFLPNFKILTTTSPGKIDAPDKCYVSLFSSDVTQQVLDSIRASVQSFCTTLDATISGMDFSHLVTQSIGKGFRKSAINNYGYLFINPSSIHIGQLNYVKDSFSISIGLTCKPQMSSDSVNLEIGEVHVPVSVGENLDNVSAYVDANYDYHFLSKLLSDTLKNRVFEYKGRTIVIKDAAIKGVGNHQVEVRIDFSGTNKGRLYLRGTPILDTLKQILTVPDISYSLESGDLALKIGKSLFSNKIKKTLKGNSYLDIAALIRSNRAVLDSMVNRKIDNNFTLGGKINEVRIVGLLPQNNYLQAQIHVIAKLAILSNGSF